jgi:hypothetical protein
MSDTLNACGNDFSDTLLDAAGELDRRRWIPVAERLPDEGERVLAWDNDFNESEVAIYYAHDGWGCDASISLNVTHWMPLPAPPTARK